MLRVGRRWCCISDGVVDCCRAAAVTGNALGDVVESQRGAKERSGRGPTRKHRAMPQIVAFKTLGDMHERLEYTITIARVAGRLRLGSVPCSLRPARWRESGHRQQLADAARDVFDDPDCANDQRLTGRRKHGSAGRRRNARRFRGRLA